MEKQVEYVGNHIYEDGSLKFIITDDGRLVPNGTGFDYEYFIKDYLGNNRVTVKDSLGFASVQQEDHFYPFGMALSGQSYQNPLQSAVNRYLYNGKELQYDNGLNLYDYGFRMYDPQLGRFHVPDPLTDFYPGITPYSYAHDDPINYIDYEGLGPKKWIRWIRKTVYKLFHRNTESISRHSRVKHKNFRTKGGGGGPKPAKNNNENRPTGNVDYIGSIGFDGFGNNVEIPDIDQVIDLPNAPPQIIVHDVPAVAGQAINVDHSPFKNYGNYYLTPVRTSAFLRPIANALRQNRNLGITIIVCSGAPGNQRCTIYTGDGPADLKSGPRVDVNQLLLERGNLLRQTLLNNGVQNSQIRVLPRPNNGRPPANRITIVFR